MNNPTSQIFIVPRPVPGLLLWALQRLLAPRETHIVFWFSHGTSFAKKEEDNFRPCSSITFTLG
jgi:hypothetical protein